MTVDINIDIDAQGLINIEKTMLGGVISGATGIVGNLIGILGDQVQYWRNTRARNYERILKKVASRGLVITLDKNKIDNVFLYKWLNAATLEKSRRHARAMGFIVY